MIAENTNARVVAVSLSGDCPDFELVLQFDGTISVDRFASKTATCENWARLLGARFRVESSEDGKNRLVCSALNLDEGEE